MVSQIGQHCRSVSQGQAQGPLSPGVSVVMEVRQVPVGPHLMQEEMGLRAGGRSGVSKQGAGDVDPAAMPHL